MEFSNEEIRKHLVDKLVPKMGIRYKIDDTYVNAESKQNFDYVIFDGEKESFYLSFTQSQTSLFVENEEICFIDDEEKQYYTSSDTESCIVYEGLLNQKTHEEILDLLLQFINLFNGAYNLKVNIEPMPKSVNDSYQRNCYYINMNNPYFTSGEYIFENITICVN